MNITKKGSQGVHRELQDDLKSDKTNNEYTFLCVIIYLLCVCVWIFFKSKNPIILVQ